MNSPIARLKPAMSIVWLCSASCMAQGDAQEQPSVTPYRPTVSTPASLSAPGWLELEAGVDHEHVDTTARRDSLPYTLKLAITPDWGIRLGGDAWVHQVDEAGHGQSGGGDTSLVLKRRFAVNDASAFGLEAGATWPTSAHGIGREKADYTLNGIYSVDLGDFHADLNLSPTRLGAVEPGASRTQWLWAAALSKSLNGPWTIEAELSGTRQSGAGSSSQFLAAAAYSVSKSVSLDAGFARSIRSGPNDWQVFAGFTWLLARVF